MHMRACRSFAPLFASFLSLFSIVASSSIANDCSQALSAQIDVDRGAYDAVYASPLYRRCRYFTQRILKTFTNNITGYFLVPNGILSALMAGEKVDHLEEIAGYVDYCLPHPMHMSNDLFRAFAGSVQARLVYITKAGDQFNLPYCNGFLHDGVIVTARHCVFDPVLSPSIDVKYGNFKCKGNQLNPTAYRYWLSYPEGAPVELLVRPELAEHPPMYANFPDAACLRPVLDLEGRSAVAESDWIKLPIDGSRVDVRKAAEAEAQYVEAKDLETGDPEVNFISVSSNKFKMIVTLSKDKSPGNSFMYETVSLDAGQLCRPIFIRGTSFAHGCHTQDISSGSPIVAYKLIWDAENRPSIEWSFVGINTGLAAYESACATMSPIGEGVDGAVRNGGLLVR